MAKLFFVILLRNKYANSIERRGSNSLNLDSDFEKYRKPTLISFEN